MDHFCRAPKRIEQMGRETRLIARPHRSEVIACAYGGLTLKVSPADRSLSSRSAARGGTARLSIPRHGRAAPGRGGWARCGRARGWRGHGASSGVRLLFEAGFLRRGINDAANRVRVRPLSNLIQLGILRGPAVTKAPQPSWIPQIPDGSRASPPLVESLELFLGGGPPLEAE